MIKLCTKCRENKPYDEFFANKGCKDGLGSWCKKCQANYNKTYYKGNKNKYRARLKHYRQEIKSKITALKESSTCADCSNYYPPVCMDFDHVRGKKLFDISSYSGKCGSMSWERIQQEIDKCELVCANCHRLRTERRSKPALV